MKRSTSKIGLCLLSAAALFAGGYFANSVEAAGSSSRWYVMTPWGPIAKTQLYGGAYIRNPARIQQYQQQQATQGMPRTKTTTQPTTRTKK